MRKGAAAVDKQDKKVSVLLYADWAAPLRSLPLEDIGRLFLGILDYITTGAAPVLDNPGAAMAWQFMRMRLDDNLEKWDATRQKRREAGSIGGKLSQAIQANNRQEAAQAGQANASAVKQTEANQANASTVKQTQANQAVPVPAPVPVPVPAPEPVPVPVPVPVAAKAALQASPDGEPPLPPPECEQEQEKVHTPEAQWVALGLGKTLGPIVRQTIQTYREAGLEDGLMVEAMREAAAHQVKAPAAYLDSILGRCRAEGILTLSAWQARKRPAGAGLSKRVDRPTPSGNDFLADAVTRPRRHKRKNPA